MTLNLLDKCKDRNITSLYLRSPLTCTLYRAICQKCYGWDLANENLVDIGEAVGILAGQSIGEPGTQLTMRTFHTGGIFTSEAREQILSPANGIIQYYKLLKTVILRTNRGEDVLVTKNPGSLILLPDNPDQNLIRIEVLRNTILFPKNNQYILKDTVIGELINKNKQIRTEIKPIISNEPGEVFIPYLKTKLNVLNNNKLIWVLAGQVYNSPQSSFLNFYPDYKLNPYSFIFRTKIINHLSGYSQYLNNNKISLYQNPIYIQNTKYSFLNSYLYKLNNILEFNNYLWSIEGVKYLVKIEKTVNNYNFQLTRNKQVATLVTNAFKTLTGGTLFYDYRNVVNPRTIINPINYYFTSSSSLLNSQVVTYKTLVWLAEEMYEVNCEQTSLLVDHGDVISTGFELIPGVFSKSSGLVIIEQTNQIVKTIHIKSGLVYEGKKFPKLTETICYPGEQVCTNIITTNLTFCEQFIRKSMTQLLIRPIILYEFPKCSITPKNVNFSSQQFPLYSKSIYLSKSNQTIKGFQNFNLVTSLLLFKINQPTSKNSNLCLDLKDSKIEFQVNRRLSLTSYIPPSLKYKNLQISTLVQKNQFISKYTTLGYLEAVTKDSLEIVKCKIKKGIPKQILVISNNDCLVIPKKNITNKELNDLVITTKKANQNGKIIIENSSYFTIQKGQPYFFPNCQMDSFENNINLQYKLVPAKQINAYICTQRNISINYRNILQVSLTNKLKSIFQKKSLVSIKVEFTRFFLKKNGKLYSSLLPQFFKKVNLYSFPVQSEFDTLVRTTSPIYNTQQQYRTLLLQSSNLKKNKYLPLSFEQSNLTLVHLGEQPLIKSTKALGLYSITEDFIEQEVNSVFCQNGEFIERGKTIGLLNLEKEITGDIVQGLPRIEEILEARKKTNISKRSPTSHKKGLLIQKSTLDPNFDFRKLGTPIKENDKVNPHKLLKVYFNYYGLLKLFICDRTESIKYNRLLTNYEGTYKSFKKVQAFILNSVQSVYQSQGVTINDKHLEVIIKQMTTQVLITYEGDTPLLRREILDLYHMKYVNEIILNEKKQLAYYIPLLLGISKAALNNPSFISAASFQETTRVLTKAAIAGRRDWLRGLKENIIIGHLIPAGTGSHVYRNTFKRVKTSSTLNKSNFTSISSFN